MSNSNKARVLPDLAAQNKALLERMAQMEQLLADKAKPKAGYTLEIGDYNGKPSLAFVNSKGGKSYITLSKLKKIADYWDKGVLAFVQSEGKALD